MDKYETGITYNMGETCVDSVSINELLANVDSEQKEEFVEKLLSTKLTYGHIQGSPQLKAAIANLYNDPTITADNVVVTNGAIGANFLALYALVNSGDHVVVVDPTYQQLPSVPRMFGATVARFKVHVSDNYLPDLKKLELTISANGTSLLVINTPNNPTGYVWGNDTLHAVIAICAKYNVTLFADEVYRPLFHGKKASSAASLGAENVIVSGSMSKAFSLAGLRLGWLVTKNKQMIASLLEKRDYNMISVLILDDAAASLALQNVDSLLERNLAICQKNLAAIRTFVEDCSGAVEWVEPKGGTTCFLRITKDICTMKLAEDLAQNHSVLVVPGEVFDSPGWIRIGFGNATASIEGGLKVLLEYLN